MLGFATVPDREGALKNGISVRIPGALVCIYRSTQPTDLFSRLRIR